MPWKITFVPFVDNLKNFNNLIKLYIRVFAAYKCSDRWLNLLWTSDYFSESETNPGPCADRSVNIKLYYDISLIKYSEFLILLRKCLLILDQLCWVIQSKYQIKVMLQFKVCWFN